MRRSKSLSRIPMRQSRVSVRTPIVESRARSEVRNSNMLSVMSRPRSTSNLRESITPLRTRSVLFTPGSGSSSKDCRQITSKDWQQTEFLKAKNFFYDLDHNLTDLKPLSINVFVRTMDLLLGMLDDRINVTMENFKEGVPMHLKKFRYPTLVKLSLMKTVNVPSNFPHILAIWSWLINHIVLLQNPMPALHPAGVDDDKLAKYDIMHNYLKCRFHLWNKNLDESIADDMYRKEMVQHLNINVKAKEQLEAECVGLEIQLATLKEKKADFVSKNKDLQEKTSEIKKRNIGYLDSKDRENLLLQQSNVMDSLEKYKELVKTKQASNQILKEKVVQQTCSFKQKAELIKKIEELNYTVELKQKRIEQRRELVSKYDYTLAERSREIKSTVYCMNNNITTLSLKRPELKCLNIRDSGYARPDVFEELNSMKEKRKIYLETYKAELVELQTKLKLKMETQKEEILAIKKLDAKIAKLQHSRSQLEHQMQKERAKGDKHIKALQDEHRKLAASLSDVIAERISLKDREDRLKMNLERERMLKKQLNEIRDAGNEFFIDLVNTIQARIFKFKKDDKKLAEVIDNACAVDVYENVAKVLQLDVIKDEPKDDEDP